MDGLELKQQPVLLTNPSKKQNLEKVKMLMRLYLFLFGASMLNSGCTNDLKEVEVITETEIFPVEVADSIQIIYSDSALLKVILDANHLERFVGENPHIKMTQGVHVRFFNNLGNVESELRSNRAVSYENTDIMEAKENVVVVNKKGETLNTEHLIWEEKTERIHTEEFVKITTEDEVIFGHGFESNQDFTKYRIKKIKGTINLREDAETTEGS